MADRAREEDKRDAGAMLMTGAAIGVLGVVSAAIGGAVCPVCVVAAPALLGIGAYKRWRAENPPKTQEPARIEARPVSPGRRAP
jgi:uncharacterized membrane protein YebE (DUF533 family)